ncbi:MAG: class I SAM-dependent methyltransferase [Motilibacteraceae bacterium]
MPELPPLTIAATLRWDVVSRLLPADAQDVLEVGCGQGAVGARLARRYPRYLGLEPDPTSYAVARRRIAAVGRGEVRNATFESLEQDEPDRGFDVVCAFEVLEHLEDDVAALAAWAGRLRRGGTLALSVPGYQHRLGPWDAMVGHYRRYDPPVLAERLRAAGLTGERVVHYGFPVGLALETARNLVARRRGGPAAEAATSGQEQERTATSGRLLQPARPLAGLAMRAAAAPWRPVQRRFPDRGITLVAVARRP